MARKIAEGNRSKVGKRKLVAPAEMSGDPPKAPARFSIAERMLWTRIVESMPSHFRAADAMLLELLVRSLTLWRQADEQVRREGLTVAGSKGPVQHPSLRSRAKFQDEARRVLVELAMSPVGRRSLPPAELAGGCGIEMFFAQDGVDPSLEWAEPGSDLPQ